MDGWLINSQQLIFKKNNRIVVPEARTHTRLTRECIYENKRVEHLIQSIKHIIFKLKVIDDINLFTHQEDTGISRHFFIKGRM